MGVIMTVMDIEKAIELLSAEEFTTLMFWMSEYRNAKWDREIEEDFKAGRLDTLINSALADIESGHVQSL